MNCWRNRNNRRRILERRLKTGEWIEMINYFRNIFTSDYDNDPAFVRLVRVVLALSALSTAIIAVILAFAAQRFASVVAVLVVAILSAISLFLAHRNILWPGKAIFPLTVLAAVIFLAINAHGLHDSSIVGFTTVIIFTSLFAGQKAIPLATFSTLLGVWAVAYADMTGINTSPLAYRTGWDDVAVITIVQVIAAASLNGLMSRLSSVLENIRRSEKELLENNRELTDIRASLEDKVIERTRAADVARMEAEAQAWYARGQVQLAEKMRGELDVPMLANNVTSFLCQYLDAHTGALFLAFGDTLKLTGRYAYVEHANRKSEFRIGENLIGEVAKSNRKMKFVATSGTAPLISSALGDAKPNQILIAPIEADGKVFGVVELATLGEFTDKHETFLSHVSESVAIAFRTAQTRLRMNELLMQSQQQAEELQSQEEELRAANEQLQAQAENLSSIVRKNKWDTT
jgi:GAF domain-containing protein